MKAKLAKLAKSVKKQKTVYEGRKRKAEEMQKRLEEAENSKKKRIRIPYLEDSKILLVGEGNFSFSLALCRRFHTAENLTATNFDSKEVTLEKYPDAEEIVAELEECEGTVWFGVDAAMTHKTFKGKQFDFVVFQFPHVGLGIKDQDRNIKANQDLISSFLVSAAQILSPNGQIHVTVKQVPPYTLWDVKKIAKRLGLDCVESFDFVPSAYPEYAHRRTLGFQDGLSKDGNEEISGKNPRTFCFCRKSEQKRIQKDQESD